jgi:hypothetical protein
MGYAGGNERKYNPNKIYKSPKRLGAEMNWNYRVVDNQKPDGDYPHLRARSVKSIG